MPDSTSDLTKPAPPRLDSIVAVCLLGWILFVVVHLAKGRLFHAGIDTATATLTGVLLYAARLDRGDRRGLIGNLNLTISTAGILFVCLFSGQSLAIAGWYLPVIPLVAVYQFGARGAVIWSGIVFVVLTFLQHSERFLTIPPEYIAAGSEIWFGQVFMLGVLVLFAVASHRGMTHYILALEHYEVRLVQKAAALRAHADDLQEARDEALTALRVKGEFLANMSHEIRTPLNGVLGMTRVLLDTSLSSEQRKMLTAIDTSGQALMGVISEVLDFSKIESNEMKLDSIAFGLRDSVEDALELFSRTAHEKGIDLAYFQHENVPLRVLGDPHRIRQILLNLVNNAVKFTPANLANASVIVESSWQNGVMTVAVKDRGIGISQDEQARLFESFVQVDASMARRHGGTGLGLAICKGLVQAMNGTIRVESVPQEGSTFCIEIPMEEAPVLLQTVDLDDALALLDRNLFIIGRDCASRSALVALAHTWAMNVDATLDPEFAMDIVHDSPPDIIVVWDDQASQGTMDSIRSHTRDVPVLRCTDLVGNSGTSMSDVAGVIHRPIRLRHVLPAFLHALHLEQQDAPSAVLISQQLPLNVLVVEDNAVNQQVVVNMLERLGYSPAVASTGLEAVNLAKAEVFDFIFMDMHMPEMDGLAATRLIRKGPFGDRPWIAALTASVLEEQRDACVEAGMNDFVPKPFRFEMLVSAIERAGHARGLLTVPEPRPHPQGVQLRELYIGREDAFRDLIGRHLETSTGLIASLRKALARADLATLELSAHSLKSSSAMFDETEISAMAAKLEHMAKNNSLGDASEVLGALEDEWVLKSAQWESELSAL